MITIDTEDVYTVGDIHGYPQAVVREMRRRNIRDAALILLGDCGLGMLLDKVLPHLQQELAEHNNVMYLVRGNHDNPFRFAEGQGTGYDRIRVLPDSTLVNIHGELGIVLGGAFSTDRHSRRLGETYWEEELLDMALAERAAKALPRPVSFVLAHNAPEPPNADGSFLGRQALNQHDRELIRMAYDEQDKVSRALELFHPARWYAGHWHLHADFMSGDTRVLIHDEFELRPWA